MRKGVRPIKYRDLIKILKNNGWYQVREGGNHEVWTNGKEVEMVPRHKEIAENLAKAIIKRRGLK